MNKVRALLGLILAPALAGLPLLAFETLALGVPLSASSAAVLVRLAYTWFLPVYLLVAGLFLVFAQARGLRCWWQYLLAGSLFGGAVALGMAIYLDALQVRIGGGLIGLLVSYAGLVGAALHGLVCWRPRLAAAR